MSKEQLSDILAELALDPVMFVETMLQVKPEKWQIGAWRRKDSSFILANTMVDIYTTPL